MIASRVSVGMVVVVSILAIANGQPAAQQQGTSGGKGCVFHPTDGTADVPVANGDTYSPAIQGSKQKHMTGAKWLC
jgi:hypothetical protein